MATKNFHIGDILSITTDRLVSPRHMDSIYDILNFMTRDNLLTPQLPRASNKCRPHLLEQFPQLKDVDASEVTPKNWRNWLNKQVAHFGKEFPVHQIPKGRYEHRNSIEELVEIVGSEKVIVAVHE